MADPTPGNFGFSESQLGSVAWVLTSSQVMLLVPAEVSEVHMA
jgi:hypothetical protein